MAKWNVPVISQRTINLCWEACGQMMWQWRYLSSPGMRGQYNQRAGAYTTMNQGLTENQMNIYYRQLGIRSLSNPSGRNITHALRWTPVIVTSINQAAGHAMIISGVIGTNYYVVNPCSQMVLNFDTGSDSCTGGDIQQPQSTIESNLGTKIWYW